LCHVFSRMRGNSGARAILRDARLNARVPQALAMDAPVWPDQESVLALVRRLPDDPVAPAEFEVAVYLPLLHDVQTANRTEDPDRIVDVVTDLLLAFVKRPEQYKADKLALRSYLLMAAEGDLRNARAKEDRRKRREIPLDSVAEPGLDGKEEEDGDMRAWLDDPRVAEVIAGFNETDRAVWELMRTGKRSTAAFAPVLGIADRPQDEQGREVKRVKDRLMKRLKRAAEGGR
jgi:hypothetical protein